MYKYLFYILLFFLLIGSSNSVKAQDNQQIANQINLAKHYNQIGQHQKAKDIYEKLYKARSWDANIIGLYNSSLLQLKEYNKSIEILTERLNSNPKDLTTYGILGSTYFIMGLPDSAIAVWNRGTNVQPEAEIGYRVISQYAAQNRDYNLAIEFLKKGQQYSKNKNSYYFEIANLQLSLMNYEDAAVEYCNLLITSPEHLEQVKQSFSRYLTRSEAINESITRVKAFLEQEKNDAVFSLLAFLYTLDGNYEEAFEIIVDLDKSNENNGALIFNFAEQSFNAKDNYAAKLAYKYIYTELPSSQFAESSLLGYARASLLLLDEKYKNKNEWKPIILPDTTNSFRYKEVIDIYDDYTLDHKNNQYYAEANYQIGNILKNKFDKPNESIEYFSRAAKYSPNSIYGISSKINLIESEICNGNILSGIESLGKITNPLMISPDLIGQAKYQYALLLFWNNQFEEANKILNEVSQNLKDYGANDAIELSLLLTTFGKDSANLSIYAKAEYLTAQNKFNEATLEYEKLADNKQIFILPEIAKFKLAEIYTVLDDYQKAIEILSDLIKNENSMFSTDKALFLLAEIYQFGLLDNDNAVNQYEKLLESFPNSIYFARSRERINLILTNKSENI